jgi:hypothetical protein
MISQTSQSVTSSEVSQMKAVDPIEVAHNTTFHVSADCVGGSSDVAPNGAKLAFWRASDKARRVVRGFVPTGQLFPACGQLYRLAAILPKGRIVIDRAPVSPPAGVSLHADAVAVPLSGSAEIGRGSVAVNAIALNDRKVATITITASDTPPGEPPSGLTTREVEVKAGSTLTILDEAFTVRAVVPPDSAHGIVGWVEINLDPKTR